MKDRNSLLHKIAWEKRSIIDRTMNLAFNDDPIIFYGSFPVLFKSTNRDIDVLIISNKVSNAVRKRLFSSLDTSQPLNIYIVPANEIHDDINSLKFGGWWVTKPILGFYCVRNSTLCQKYAYQAIHRFCAYAGIDLDDDQEGVMRNIAFSLCIFYPTFLKSVLKVYMNHEWLAQYGKQISIVQNTYKELWNKNTINKKDTMNDIRFAHYSKMYSLRPQKKCNDIVPAKEKLRQVKNYYLKNLDSYKQIFGPKAKVIIEAITETEEIFEHIKNKAG